MIDKEIIKSVAGKIAAMEYGDTITHAELAADLQVPAKSCAYRTAVCKLSRELLESGKAIENVFNVGYRITHPDDYAGQAMRQYRMGAKRLAKGQRYLQFAPVDKMTDAGRMEYNNIKDRSAALNAHVAGAVVELKLLQKKHPLQNAH